MENNPVLKDINESIAHGLVNLSRHTFLEPISIAHLAVAAKLNPGIISLPECHGNAASFLSRLNFYTYAGLHDPFGANSYTGNNPNTIEINDANNANTDIFEKVKNVLVTESQQNIETIDRLLSELITNVEMYANFGVVVGQVIDRVFHLAIVDYGPGIVKHLKSYLPSMQCQTDQYVLLASLNKGVTSGGGKGYGLWQTYEVLSRNGGTLLIRTENHIVNGVTKAYYTPNTPWLGTSVELRYNLDNPVDFSQILTMQNLVGVSDEFGF